MHIPEGDECMWKGKVISITNWGIWVSLKKTPLLKDAENQVCGNEKQWSKFIPSLPKWKLAVCFPSNSKGLNYLFQVPFSLHGLYNIYQIKKADACGHPVEKGLHRHTLFSKYNILEKGNIPNDTTKSSLFICTEVAFFQQVNICRKISHVMI